VTTRDALPLEDQVVVQVPPTVASADHPAIWFRDAVDDKLLVAYDWSGHRVGDFRVTNSEPYGALQSPDGSALVLRHAHPQTGAVAVGGARGYVTWAGDSEHLCSLRQADGSVYAGDFTSPAAPGALFLDQPGTGGSTRVITVGSFGPHGGPTVLSCSMPHDRAIVGQSFVALVSQLRTVELSTGAPRSVSLDPVPGDGPRGVVASNDGSLIGYGSSATQSGDVNEFSIYAADSGKRLTTMHDVGIVAFSDDDRFVVTLRPLPEVTPPAQPADGVYQLVDWRTMRVIWSATLTASKVVTRPDSGDVLLQPYTYRDVPGAGGTRQAFVNPIIVHADRTMVTLPEARPASD
jgi:hypothetical protein